MSNIKQKLTKLGWLAGVFLIAAVIIVPLTYGRVKPYYQGDAINYRGRLLIASTNMDRLQIIEVNDRQTNLLAELAPDKSGYLSGDDFYNCAFNQENGQLFLYAVNGRYLYKYNTSNPSQPELISKIKDNSWDWFRSVAIFNGRPVTAGTKGIKIWNNDLQVVDSLAVNLDNPFNYTLSRDFLLVIDGDQLKMYSLQSRQWTKSVNLTINNEGSRQIYNDQLSSTIYVADDWAVKQFDFEGNLLNSFKFTANNGYDVVPSSDGQKIYFSDGVGVVRLARANLQPQNWTYVKDMGVSDGWSMGLRLVNWQGQDHLVIFNNGAITILNDQMSKIANYHSVDERSVSQPVFSEPLMLSLDKNRAAVDSQISLQGAGFAANENLEIKFLSNQQAISTVTTDSFGRFQKVLIVPAIANQTAYTQNPLPTDIKVIGQTSQKNYSINFQIEN
jgi:hypothetical protein